jgi:ubiquinone/menaquinone biosynthesis C-methylase UbiE
MIDVARQDHPGLRFEVGSMTDLRLADSTAAVVAFWSLIHVPDDEVPGVLGQFRRVLRPGGPLLRDAGFTVEAQILLGPYDSVPGALLFARSRP